MGASLAFLDLLLIEAAPTVQATAEAAKTVTNFDPVWGTVITASVALFAALGGILTGLIGGLTWVSNIHQRRSDDLEKLYNSNESRLEKSFASEKRSLELTSQQKESEIKHLRERIKRLEGLFTLDFPEINQGNSVLQNLQLFLKYVQEKVQDEKLRQEVDKMTDYLEGQLGLVDELKFRLEAADWITGQIAAKSSRQSLIEELRVHVVNESLYVPGNAEEKGKFDAEVDRVIERYLEALRLIVRVSCELDFNKRNRVRSQCNSNSDYVKALYYMKDQRIGSRLSHYAYIAFQRSVETLIEILVSP